MMIKRILLPLSLLILSPLAMPAHAGTPPAAAPAAAAPAVAVNPEALLRDADRARGGIPDGITWQIDILANVDNTTEERAYLVKVHGDDALAEATAPARNKGDVLLFNDKTIWFVKPGLRKPVSIS